MGKRIVIALGGNALGNNLPEQMIAVKKTASAIVDLIEAGNEVVIAHGNGPQVGMIQNAMSELTRSNPEKYIPCPLSVCVAMSQGYIGYDLQNALREEMLDRGINTGCTTILTQVEVDANDPAFENPTKPIGAFMTKEEAEAEEEKGNFVIEEEGKGFRVLLKPLVRLFDKLLFTKVRENFGGELKFFIGGGALLDKDLQKFYYALGIPMYQGYGLSEATPIISTNGPRRHTFGSSGVLVRPLDLKICDMDGNVLPPGEKGEIVIRGENVMAGYWKNPASTADTVKEGWLYTGDMGYMRDGLLYVLGRFKSLLIGSDGEKYSPEGIEEALVEHSSCIDQLILYNNQSPYTTALLVPNKERLRKHLAHQNLDLSSDQGREEAIRIIQRQIDRFRKGGDLSTLFPDRWLPTTFAILPEPFTEQNGMVNSTMKIVRGKVEKAYAARIAQLYTPEGKNPLNKWNKEAL